MGRCGRLTGTVAPQGRSTHPILRFPTVQVYSTRKLRAEPRGIRWQNVKRRTDRQTVV